MSDPSGPGCPAPRPAPRAHDDARATVLVADDDLLVRDLTAARLRRLGYSVLVASDGAEALRTYRRRSCAVAALVLDEVMPGLPGHRIVEELRAAGDEVPVLIVTGYAPEAALERLGEASGVRILGKPFRERALADELDRLLAAGKG